MKIYNKIYDCVGIRQEIINKSIFWDMVTSNRGVSFYNIPSAFDIETSSFYDTENRKTAIMYEWTFGIDGLVCIGRQWSEFLDLMNWISDFLSLDKKHRLLIYVHNLSYEFQFMRKLFNWENVFAVGNRKPVYALTSLGIEFRCSYILSGYSLASVARNLTTYKIEKLYGSLDYTIIHTPETQLTEEELSYCVNDVLIVMMFIDEEIKRNHSIDYIPLTNTGYVRRLARNRCLYTYGLSHKECRKTKKYKNYRLLMESMQISGVEEYQMLKRAFAGGFTHCNARYMGQVIEESQSEDEASAYPAACVAFNGYPMSSGELYNPTSMKDFKQQMKLYCCIFDVRFEGLRQRKDAPDSYISFSKCWITKGVVQNNGRVAFADEVSLTITEIDYKIIARVYEWEHIYVGTFRRYKRGYIPTDLVKTILKLYENKTKFKAVEGSESDYMHSKGMLNSIYGMMVTDIIQPEIFYNEEWNINDVEVDKMIEKYNRSQNRFTFYPWGIYVTALARLNIWSAILNIGADDYIYTDTDSIKYKNPEKHKQFFDDYNNWIIGKLEAACIYHGISKNKIDPEDIKGNKHPMGVWEFDGFYTKFKTLGAKRYMYEDEKNKLHITVAGLNKQKTCDYLNQFNDPFEAFTNDMDVPACYSGKLTHTYIDEERVGTVVDYLGQAYNYREKTGVHLEKTGYNLSITKAYADYVRNVRYESEVL